MVLDRRTFLHLSGGVCLPWLVPGIEAWAWDGPEKKSAKVAQRATKKRKIQE